MRRILLILISLAIAAPCFGQDFVYFKKKAAAAGGASMCPAADADLLCEHFNGTDVNTWTETSGADITISTSNSITDTVGCDSSNTHDVSVVKGAATNTRGNVRTGITSSDNIYITYYFMLVSSDLASGETVLVGVFFDDDTDITTPHVFQDINNNAGQMRLRFRSVASDLSTGLHTYHNISAGTWYKIQLRWQRNSAGGASAGFQVLIDGTDRTVTAGTPAINSTPDVPVTTIFVGGGIVTTKQYNFEIDSLKIDSAEYPTCP